MTIAGTPPQDGDQRARSTTVSTWLNTSFQMQFRVIDGLTVRFAQSSVTRSSLTRSRGRHEPPPAPPPGPENPPRLGADLVAAGRARPSGGHRPAGVRPLPA